MNTIEQKTTYLRTFDLPDICFEDVEIFENNQVINAYREVSLHDPDTLILHRWLSQSIDQQDRSVERNGWLNVNGLVYMVWGLRIHDRAFDSTPERQMERWVFTFSSIHEMGMENVSSQPRTLEVA